MPTIRLVTEEIAVLGTDAISEPSSRYHKEYSLSYGSSFKFMNASISCDQIYLLVPCSLLGISSQQDYLPVSPAILVFV